jgi:two-component system, chemotaxis family, chemotaxis protein CheY
MPLKLENISILIAEDILPMRQTLIKLLEIMGVGKIYAAKDGRQAFNVFCRITPDIVITDWHMPVEDGTDLVHNIRNAPQSPAKLTPVIFMTGYGSHTRITQARDLGVTEYLIKPFTAADLAKRIAHVINAPRSFIDADQYFGPDRRRRNNDDFPGQRKRNSDNAKE